jgi:hypothetical protein
LEGAPGDAPRTERPLRILLFMLHPGYLRNFESTLRALGARGHHVQIGFDRLKEGLDGQLDLLNDLQASGNCCSDFVPQLPAGRSWSYFGRRARFMIDWLRYLEPPFRNARKLRDRLEAGVPLTLKLMVRLPLVKSASGRRMLRKTFTAVDRSIPPRGEITSYIASHRPDLVLITPLLEMNEIQGEYLRAARRMGISTGYLVASWDNLTSKGVIHDVPDFMIVWNEAQKREATELHGIPADRVVVSGACAYDHWFEWSPTTSRAEFCAKVGLRPDRPFLLYVGSSGFIASEEGPHVERWITRIRRLGLTDAGILVRPHPTNPLYSKPGLRNGPGSVYDRADVAVWPPEGANPTDQRSRSDYYDSIYHAAAVVGVNTSALVESAIVGREVFTMLDEDFRETQAGTLHFEHIASPVSGVLTVASSIEAHVAHLSAALDGHRAAGDRVRRFVETFIRPHGLSDPGTPRVIEAIESAAERPVREADREPGYARMVRIVLFIPVVTAALCYHIVSGFHVRKRLKRVKRRVVKGLRNCGLPVGSSTAKRYPQRPQDEEGGRDDPKMHVAFVLQYPGYLRYFDSVISSLAEHGHRVRLYFEQPRKQAEALEVNDLERQGIANDGQLPKRDDSWRDLLSAIRWTSGYVRYLDPAFRDATYLRNRVRTRLPPLARLLGLVRTLPRPIVRLSLDGLLALERAAPRSYELEKFLERIAPDVVVVSPFVTVASRQVDLVRAARARGIPTVAAIASWDHLTTKGIARPGPDLFLVWNETQVEEAMTLHRIPRSRIVVTGAQPFDRWFDRSPSSGRDEFCERVGLPSNESFVLFAGSTASISRPDAEIKFVCEWIAALGAADDPVVRKLNVLIRPHPYNSEGWADADMSECANATIWPRAGANPVDESDRADYFDSIYYSSAVIGVNTSAMIEAAVIGRPVLTIEVAEFSETQAGTLHYNYLLPESGGFTRVARSFGEHISQLGQVLRSPEATREERDRFVRTFIRPQGLDTPATPLVTQAIERAPEAAAPARDEGRWYHAVLRMMLLPAARIMAYSGGRARARSKAERAASLVGEQ